MTRRVTALDKALERTGWIPVPVAGERTGIHFTTLYRWIRADKLAARSVRGYKYIRVDDLRALLGPDVADELGIASVAPDALAEAKIAAALAKPPLPKRRRSKKKR